MNTACAGVTVNKEWLGEFSRSLLAAAVGEASHPLALAAGYRQADAHQADGDPGGKVKDGGLKAVKHRAARIRRIDGMSGQQGDDIGGDDSGIFRRPQSQNRICRCHDDGKSDQQPPHHTPEDHAFPPATRLLV